MTSKTRDLLLACLAGGVLACGLGSANALAAGPTALGTFNKWVAWKGTDANGVICYISAKPDDTEPKNVNRDPIHFLIINRLGLGTRNEVQTLVGYPMKDGGVFSANIDGTNYPMISVKDDPNTSVKENYAAWLADPKQEGAFVSAMKAGRQLVVKGTSTRGTDTTDTYSLSGVTAALDALAKDCK
ncbi:MAG TPA: invasion associated locus B family protein [Devosiaceae bacterium]